MLDPALQLLVEILISPLDPLLQRDARGMILQSVLLLIEITQEARHGFQRVADEQHGSVDVVKGSEEFFTGSMGGVVRFDGYHESLLGEIVGVHRIVAGHEARDGPDEFPGETRAGSGVGGVHGGFDWYLFWSGDAGGFDALGWWRDLGALAVAFGFFAPLLHVLLVATSFGVEGWSI